MNTERSAPTDPDQTSVVPLVPLAPPPVIGRMVAASADERAAILATHHTPISVDGTSTFVHVGAADTVAVEHFMARLPALPAMQRLADDLHTVTVRLPERARVEYKIAVSAEGGVSSGLDPHNPSKATDPFGANSVATGPSYVEPWWVTGPDRERGEVRRGFVESPAFGHRRSLHWYFPKHRVADMPLLIIHDGRDFLDHAALVGVLDRLIASGALPPLIAALLDPVERGTEYSDDPRHARFVAEVVAAAVRRFGAHSDPAAHVYVGASLGAVASLSAAWRSGGVGGLVLLSGSFVTSLGGPTQRGPMFLPVIDFMARFEDAPGQVATTVYQACGEYEGLAPDNRRFAPIVAQHAETARYRESPDGHHWHNWRDHLGPALATTVLGADPELIG